MGLVKKSQEETMRLIRNRTSRDRFAISARRVNVSLKPSQTPSLNAPATVVWKFDWSRESFKENHFVKILKGMPLLLEYSRKFDS